MISINLQRCEISFINQNQNGISKSDDAFIRFTLLFQTKICYLREDPVYSVLILSEQAQINKTLIVNKTGNDHNIVSLVCICDIGYNTFHECLTFYIGFFKFPHSKLAVDQTNFAMEFKSRMIDLIIDPEQTVTIPYVNSYS